MRLIVATAKPANDGHDVCSVLEYVAGGDERGRPGNWAASFFTAVNAIICNMRSPKKKATAAKLRAWRASLLRSRAHLLGIVYAADEKSAEAAAIAEFKIRDD